MLGLGFIFSFFTLVYVACFQVFSFYFSSLYAAGLMELGVSSWTLSVILLILLPLSLSLFSPSLTHHAIFPGLCISLAFIRVLIVDIPSPANTVLGALGSSLSLTLLSFSFPWVRVRSSATPELLSATLTRSLLAACLYLLISRVIGASQDVTMNKAPLSKGWCLSLSLSRSVFLSLSLSLFVSLSLSLSLSLCLCLFLSLFVSVSLSLSVSVSLCLSLSLSPLHLPPTHTPHSLSHSSPSLSLSLIPPLLSLSLIPPLSPPSQDIGSVGSQ